MFPRNSGYQYSDCRMFLLKINDDGTCDFRKAMTSCYQRECYLIYECLEPGSWMLFTEVDYVSSEYDNQYNITAYCEMPVNFSHCDIDRAQILSMCAQCLVEEEPDG